MKKNLKYAAIDLLLAPTTLVSALWLKYVRTNLVPFFEDRSVVSKWLLDKVGVFPILDHFYEPLFNTRKLRFPLQQDRNLPAIAWNTDEQLSLLGAFKFNDEILEIAKRPSDRLVFSFDNGAFSSGDADYLYNIVRLVKPRRIIEIGCGHSTLMMQHAIGKNREEDRAYSCEHTCIEPYLNDWLEKLPVTVRRNIVEAESLEIFQALESNDILFIDSSHIIRPQGDVLFEYLEILPSLQKGVFVHVHDIFTPKDYPAQWIQKGKVFWNEQYLLEAFLSFNDSFKVMGALNLLKHRHFAELSAKCPMLSSDSGPGSFWMKKIK